MRTVKSHVMRRIHEENQEARARRRETKRLRVPYSTNSVQRVVELDDKQAGSNGVDRGRGEGDSNLARDSRSPVVQKKIKAHRHWVERMDHTRRD